MTKTQIEEYLVKLENDLLNNSEKRKLNFQEIGLTHFQMKRQYIYLEKMEKSAMLAKLVVLKAE